MFLSRVDAFATRAGERSRWTQYSPTKRRVAASILTVEAAIVSFGTSWLLLRSEEAGGAPWFIGGSLFIGITAFVWGLTINPTKATKWALLLGVPFILVVGVGGSLAVVAANVVSGARDQIRDQFTSGPLGASLSSFGTASLQSGEWSNHSPDRIRAVPLATLWRRFRAWTRASHGYRFGAEATSHGGTSTHGRQSSPLPVVLKVPSAAPPTTDEDGPATRASKAATEKERRGQRQALARCRHLGDLRLRLDERVPRPRFPRSRTPGHASRREPRSRACRATHRR